MWICGKCKNEMATCEQLHLEYTIPKIYFKVWNICLNFTHPVCKGFCGSHPQPCLWGASNQKKVLKEAELVSGCGWTESLKFKIKANYFELWIMQSCFRSSPSGATSSANGTASCLQVTLDWLVHSNTCSPAITILSAHINVRKAA